MSIVSSLLILIRIAGVVLGDSFLLVFLLDDDEDEAAEKTIVFGGSFGAQAEDDVLGSVFLALTLGDLTAARLLRVASWPHLVVTFRQLQSPQLLGQQTTSSAVPSDVRSTSFRRLISGLDIDGRAVYDKKDRRTVCNQPYTHSLCRSNKIALALHTP